MCAAADLATCILPNTLVAEINILTWLLENHLLISVISEQMSHVIAFFNSPLLLSNPFILSEFEVLIMMSHYFLRTFAIRFAYNHLTGAVILQLQEFKVRLSAYSFPLTAYSFPLTAPVDFKLKRTF